MIHGVLLEGVDYAGKTCIADALTRSLNSMGVAAVQNQCYLKRGPLIQHLEAQAKRLDSALERDWYYTSALLVDLYLYENEYRRGDIFVVQDRHWLTTLGRNEFFNQDLEFMRPGLLEERHIPFRYNVYVTSSVEAKIRRCRDRPPKSPRDRYLAENPEIHQRYDEFLLQRLPPEENWLILDTSDLSIEEATEVILSHVELAPIVDEVLS